MIVSVDNILNVYEKYIYIKDVAIRRSYIVLKSIK